MTSLSADALGILRDHMEEHGLDIPNKDLSVAEIHKLCKKAIGWTGIAEVLEREYQGRINNDVVRLSEGGESEEETEEGEYEEPPTADEVNEMSAKDLKGLNEDWELGLDLSDYKSLKAKREAINEALDEYREEETEEEAEEGEGDDLPTDEEIDEMGITDLKALNKEQELGVANPPKGAKARQIKKFRDAIKEAVAQLAEEESEEGEEEGEELETISRARLDKMPRKALADKIEEYQLDLDPDDPSYKDKKGLEQLRDEAAELLDEQGLLEE